MSLDKLCRQIKDNEPEAINGLFAHPAIVRLVESQVRYFSYRFSSYTDSELRALVQNVVWQLITANFRDPSSEHSSGMTVLSFLKNFLGKNVAATLLFDTTRQPPEMWAQETPEYTPEDTVDRSAIATEKKQLVQKALNLGKESGALSAQDIRIICLRTYDELPYDQIALKCTQQFSPQQPYTKGWAHARYQKSLITLKGLLHSMDVKKGDI